MKKKLKVSVFEIVAYSILGLLALWGIVYLCLGFACNFVHYDSALLAQDKAFRAINGLGFLEQGIIILVVAVIVFVVVLLTTSKKSDREYEKTQRRAARMSQRRAGVVDAEVEEIPAEKDE